MSDPNESQIFSIVFVGGPKGRVNIHFEGLTTERKKEIEAMTAEEQAEKMTHTEFWAVQCFLMSCKAMAESETCETVTAVKKETPS